MRAATRHGIFYFVKSPVWLRLIELRVTRINSMSTVSAAGVPVARRSTGIRVFLWLILVIALAAGGALVYAYLVARSALPQLDGTLQVKGLASTVKVTRDGHGVPAIEATTLEDLFFAQGYVTAQDRLWQMDVMRRFGAGELSEILGEGTLKVDREQRILGLRAAAKKSLAMASPRDRSYFDAYARGVNAFIDAHSGHSNTLAKR
jgi:penicillin amidase